MLRIEMDNPAPVPYKVINEKNEVTAEGIYTPDREALTARINAFLAGFEDDSEEDEEIAVCFYCDEEIEEETVFFVDSVGACYHLDCIETGEGNVTN